MITFIEKRPILTIILVVAVMLLPNLDALEITIMEARNFISAREMLTDGNWVLTTMNGAPRYQKPPLPTWITALSAMVFGVKSIWGLRLPAVLMMMLLGVMVFLLSRKLTLSKSHSLRNGIIIVTSLYVGLILFEAPWDIYAHVFMLTSIYFIVLFLQESHSSFRNGVLAILFFAFSVLSKGPVSVYVVFIPFLIAFLVCFKGATFKKRFPFLGLIIVIGLVLGFSWYGYVRFADPEAFLRITTKETGNWTSYNVRPFYYYWSFFTQSGLWTIPAFVSLLYPYMKTRVSHPKVYKFTLIWTLLAVVLLSIIPEKKSRYLMPVLIPLAMNTGFYVAYLVRRFRDLKDKREAIPVYVMFVIAALAIILGVIAIVIVYGAILPWYTFACFVLAIILGLMSFKALYHKDIHVVFYRVVIGLVFGVLGVLSFFNKTIENKNYQSFSNINNPSGLALYSYDMSMPEMVWEYGRVLPRLDSLSSKNPLLEKEFLVLECTNCDYDIYDELSDYTLKQVDKIDLNTSSATSKKYKTRKTARVFLASRK